MIRLERYSWPLEGLGELLSELASSAGLSVEKLANPSPLASEASAQTVASWIEGACERLAIEAQAATISYPEVGAALARSAPALFRVVGSRGTPRFVGLVGRSRGRVRLVAPGGRLVTVPMEVMEGWLTRRAEATVEGEIEAILDRTGVKGRRRSRAKAQLLRQQLGSVRLGGVWFLRMSQGSPFRDQLRRGGVSARVGLLVAVHVLQNGLWIGSWWLIGSAALGGRADPGMLALWVLMLLSLVPLRMAGTWLQGSVAIRAGSLLKQRLLYGSLRLAPEEVRHQGAGQLLARVFESEALEALALSGGFLLLLGGVEVVMAGAVLTRGAGGWLQALLLLGWTVIAGALAQSYFRKRVVWTEGRLQLTDALVDSMLGQRTRQVQEPRERWHEEEDRQVESYSRSSRALDRAAVRVTGLIPRGWMVVGLLGLAPVIVRQAPSAAELAVAVGGLLLAYSALEQLAGGLSQLLGAGIAWRQVREMFQAAARPVQVSEPDLVFARDSSRGRCLLEARELGFAYEGRAEPVLRNLDLEVRRGDRLLLEGDSGCGKSTLASIVAGLRTPTSGLMLMGGLDQASTGSRQWRRSVVLVPQFHENHVLNESLAFNVLMGRHWPPFAEDLAEAEEVLRELGLGSMLDRMPGGLFQMVGETGWQLSHGERSRVFIARTLLQQHEIALLDESLGGLDGDTALTTARVVLARSPTVAVIGHE